MICKHLEKFGRDREKWTIDFVLGGAGRSIWRGFSQDLEK